MNTQPNEIITHILSYLDNYELNLFRRICHKWKTLIEGMFGSDKPPLHTCILNRNYYHFGKHYLNYPFDTTNILVCWHCMNDGDYYMSLTKLLDRKLIEKQIKSSFKYFNAQHVLIYAAYRGHADVVQYCINQNIDIHADDDRALRLSASAGHLHIVKYLVEAGADISADFNDAVLQGAINGNLEIIKYFASKDKNVIYNEAVLELSVINGHLDIVKYLVSYGANIHIFDDLHTHSYYEWNHLEMIQYLISLGVNLCTSAMIQNAIRNGNLDIVKYLFSLGFDINSLDIHATLYDIMRHHLEPTTYDLCNGWDNRDSTTEDRLEHLYVKQVRSTDLFCACPEGTDVKSAASLPDLTRPFRDRVNNEMIEYLVGQMPNLRDNKDYLFVMGLFNNDIELIKSLTIIDIHDNDELALRWCVVHNRLDLVKYFVSCGANVNARYHYAIRWSAHLDNLEMVKYLINVGANKGTADRFGSERVREYLKNFQKN